MTYGDGAPAGPARRRSASPARLAYAPRRPDGDRPTRPRAERAVLHDVTFDVAPPAAPSRSSAPTGCGKSTLTSLLVRLVDPDAGAVLLDGDDLRDLARGGVAEHGGAGAASRRSCSTTPCAATSRSARTSTTSEVWDALRAGPGRRLRGRAAGTGWTPGSASAAPPCPAASGSGSRWPGRWSAGPGCWCWTTRPPRRPGRWRRAILRGAALRPTLGATVRRRRLPPGHHRAGRRGGLHRATAASSTAARTTELLGAHPGLRAAWSTPTSDEAERRAGLVDGEDGDPMTRMSMNRPLATDDVLDPGRAPGARTARSAPSGAGCGWSPELRQGLGGTLLLALLATAGRVVVPLAVQQTLDRGLAAPGGPDMGVSPAMVAGRAVAVVVTAVASYLMNVRLFRTTETRPGRRCGSSAFRHVHDLSMLHPDSRAARLAGLPGDQRRRPDLAVHAVRRPDAHRQRRAAAAWPPC